MDQWLEKLDWLREVAGLYSINFRNAGIGFTFCDPVYFEEKVGRPLIDADFTKLAKRVIRGEKIEVPLPQDGWKKALVTWDYFDDFITAIEAEVARYQERLGVKFSEWDCGIE